MAAILHRARHIAEGENRRCAFLIKNTNVNLLHRVTNGLTDINPSRVRIREQGGMTTKLHPHAALIATVSTRPTRIRAPINMVAKLFYMIRTHRNSRYRLALRRSHSIHNAIQHFTCYFTTAHFVDWAEDQAMGNRFMEYSMNVIW